MGQAPATSLPGVLAEHALEAAHLRVVRSVLVRAPHVGLFELHRHDERIVAHLDGLAVGGDDGQRRSDAALAESPGLGEVFAAAARALATQDAARIDRLLEIGKTSPAACSGVHSAFGWASSTHLRGVVSRLLSSNDPAHRTAGLAACALHRTDPGDALTRAVSDADPAVRRMARRAAGALGRRDLYGACVDALHSPEPEARFMAARSATLLGSGTPAAPVLTALADEPGPWQVPALALLVMRLDLAPAQELLRGIARDPANTRLLIRGAGYAGDLQYVPWLLKKMREAPLARVAGEAFTLITGADLAALGFEAPPPEPGMDPREDPANEDIAVDEDESLPWPDVGKVERWWSANAERFARGTRCFMGGPPSAEHCRRILHDGRQRQRIAAAHHLCLLQPGTILFNCAAPARRQRRLLSGPA